MKVGLGLAAADMAEVAAVLSDAFADYPVPMTFTPEILQRMCAEEDVVLEACGLVRDRDGRLLGAGLAALRGDCGRIAAMGVRQDAQRRGVGRALGDALLGSLSRAGASRVILEALTINQPALRLYEAGLGFRRRRRLVGFERRPGGPPIEPSAWDRALTADGEPSSWQLAAVVRIARRQSDLVFVPAVVPEQHPVARLLADAGFAEAQVDQFELERALA